MDKLVSKVLKNLRSQRLIAKGDAVLVAVSGGVDSMVLLDIMRRLAEAQDFTVFVAHFNHQLRGRASELDEKLVKDYCAQYDLRYDAGKGAVSKLTKEKKISIEMAARELRLNFLAKTAREAGCQRIALAHHADDQVELFFIRFVVFIFHFLLHRKNFPKLPFKQTFCGSFDRAFVSHLRICVRRKFPDLV